MKEGNKIEKRNSNGLTVVDLFCGAGIGAVGLKLAGFNIVEAIDNKKYAVDTYNLNIGDHARVADIRKLRGSDIKDADIIIGGFPCTPFSVAGAGAGQLDLKNGDLGAHFFRIVKEKQPKAFLVENVKGITYKKHREFFEWLNKSFESIGYDVKWELMNCFEYGVPQERERVFIVGIRKDIKKEFTFPSKTPEKERKTLKNAIEDLGEPTNETRIKNHANYYKGGFSPRYLSRNRQRQWNEPSFTIVATARQLPLHPSPPNYDIRKIEEYEIPPPRRFTVRECLRIQTVPDWFYFDENVKLENQYERCSGIPSLITYKLGIQLEKTLN
ncbi:DNA cytosine methyltransferase [Bacillus pumilus]|uniref:DNA cytosine methyltransferase n=1 Tax=Bacillus pumilus TaxID=1408 RepID=UPI002DDC8FBC|nr:DNA cytosine methyltransferase [Bacillus pumilus]